MGHFEAGKGFVEGGGDGDRLVAFGCRCKSWACPECGPKYWARFHAKISPGLFLFERAKMLTLTVNRGAFESGEAAYRYVQGKGLIRRFLRLMGFGKAFAWMEFHRSHVGAPDGHNWPHWHVVVDLADTARGWVDYKRGWRLWRDVWGVGMWKCGGDDRKGRVIRSASVAASYALRYAKRKNPPADWVVNAKRSPRAFEVYGELRSYLRGGSWGGEADKGGVEDVSAEDEGEADKARAVIPGRGTVGDRVRECAKAVEIVRVRRENGVERYEYVGRVEGLSVEWIQRAGERGLVQGVSVERVRFWGGGGYDRTCVSLGGRAVEDVLADLRAEAVSCVLSAAAWRQESSSLCEAIRSEREAEGGGDLACECGVYACVEDGAAPF